MTQLVPPHGGGRLKPLLIPEPERAEERKRARSLRQVPMTSREASDLIMLAMGAYTPLAGFVGYDDWRSACVDMRLADDVFWPIPITLSCTRDLASSIVLGEEVALTDAETGEIMGIMEVAETYTIDREFECKHVFCTSDPAHPGVAKTLAQAEVNLAGRVRVLSEGIYPLRYPDLFLRPAETRALFADKGWSKVAAFQTRNPMHRSHEYLAKVAIEVCDGVLIHQVLGALKPGDIPADVRTRAINALVEHYFAPGACVQAGYPIEMRYAGPREALLHALIRQNFGCSHMIIGRDHAGVGDYYGPFDAQRIFDALPAGSLIIQPLKMDDTFYCRRCEGIVSARTCPHGKEDRLYVSGTKLREMLSKGEDVPTQFSRPEVLAILRAYYAGSH